MKNKKLLRKMMTLAAVVMLTAGLCGCERQEAASNRRERDPSANETSVPEAGKPSETATPTTAVTPEPAGTAGKRTKPADELPVHRVGGLERANDGEMAFVWLGHSSFLLQMGSVNILCDPVFTDRSSPVSWAGPKRFSEVPMTAENTPEIDVLFLSHDHYDHMDQETILAIDSKVGAYVVPSGAETILAGWGIDPDKVYAISPWVSVSLRGVKFTMTPAQHSGGRTVTAVTLCGGVVIQDGAHSVYYTGDGGYGSHFTEIYERLGAVDLLIAECGQYNENWQRVHMFPEQSAQVAVDLHAKWMIPVHWGAFVLSTHAWDEPPARCVIEAEALGVSIATPEIGQPVKFAEIASHTNRWWEAYK